MKWQQTIIFDVSSKIQETVDDLLKQIDDILKERPIKVLEQNVGDFTVRYIYAEMNRRGWEMQIVPKTWVAFGKVSASFEIHSYKNNEKMNADKFDAEIKEIFGEMQKADGANE